MSQDAPIVVHCPACGTGFLEKLGNGKFVCSHCENVFVECPVCEGYGYYNTSWRSECESDFANCQTCHGTGLILEKESR